jgi:hypothetical protein
VKAGALGEHPAGENPLHLAGELHFVHLYEGGGVGSLGRRPGVAYARRHLERTELHGLIDGDLKMGDASRHLVERCEHRDRVLDRVCVGDLRGKSPRHRRGHRKEETSRDDQPVSGNVTSLDHAAHLLNGVLNDRSGAPLLLSMIFSQNRCPLFRIMLQHQTPRP